MTDRSLHTRLSDLLGRFSLRVQLTLGFACLSLFVIFGAIVVIAQVSSVDVSATRQSVSAEEVRAIAEDVAIDIGQWRQDEHRMLQNMNNVEVFARVREKWSLFFPHLLEDIDHMEEAELSDSRRSETSQQWRLVLTGYFNAVQQILDRIDSGELTTPAQANAALETMDPAILALTRQSYDTGIAALKRAEDAKVQMAGSIAQARLAIGVLGIGSVVLATLLTVVLSGLLTRRAKRLCKEVHRLAQGDFTSRVAMSGRDEFATIGQTINDMARRITERNAELKRDIARREQAEAKFNNAQQRYELAVRGSRDGLWDWDMIEDEIYYAPRWKAMLGYEEDEIESFPEEWIGRIVSEDLGAFQHMIAEHLEGASDEFESEFRMVRKDGTIRWMLCRGAAVRNDSGRAIRLAGSLADITEIIETQEALRNAAEHDRLTGLPNRMFFREKLEDAIHRCQRDPSQGYAVLFFDFDRFKVVNDSLGHSVGDELLISIAHRFEKELRAVDTAARFGGDEFVVLLTGLSEISYAHEVADRLVKVYEQPHSIGGHQITSTASVGLVTCEGDYDNAEDVIRDADSAMYQAKIKGKCQVIVFDKAMHSEAVDRLDLEEELRHAVSSDQLLLHHQPIVNLESGQLSGFEALVRWMHPERGLIGPDKFIPIAEDTGLIVDIGLWVLRTACLQLVDWNQRLELDKPLAMNVNLSKRQLCQPDVIEAIRNVFDETHVDPSLIKIEITESVIVDNRVDMIPLLEKIKALGVKLAMDDFGTGQSSLSGLHKFPIDVLKIDQSFVQQMEESRDVSAVVCSIVTLAHNLNMEIVAEGVETSDQLAILLSHGCEYGQGYYFAKPLPAAEAEKYVLHITGDECRARAA